MGGNSPSTIQPNGNPLASLFAGSQGYQQPQQPQQMAPPPPALQQPGYGMPALTPQQAALATQARMQARNPLIPPVVQQTQKTPAYIDHGNGGGPRGASSGGNGNGWGGH
ncbi:hypothetical protein EJ076_34765 [Mesorhizobium sp. M7D.F.Ca.US.005.01.1.1]|uniref:hypothetical protein n=1 Tax=Mesorhizobium sp. M7D.F.Ca.US.005.01.1.1 TaxID=2493678 RepID=UPI000F751F5D|nr:hypothetical protein [Mesorhizobium sp. M7D.F.Ca.US.005.01.1.1]AZO45881.1 hypothetical protein EJ076_34765 [Mesorhizobium sp. M7D.F.Ca.US.005.01.1.1]